MDGRFAWRAGRARATFTVCLTYAGRQARRVEDTAAVPVSDLRRAAGGGQRESNMEIAEFMLANEARPFAKAVNGQQAVEMFSAAKPG